LAEKKSSYPVWPYLCLIYFAYTTDCACIHLTAEEYLDSGIYYIVHILLKPERVVFRSYTHTLITRITEHWDSAYLRQGTSYPEP